jgi:DNA mismatch repair protein MutL
MNVQGFVGKPETAKKTRGDQYFFVNNRFIKSAYLNHAVNSAFENMIPKDSYPTYVLYIDLDPGVLDINVHPTKQEIKFEDEKIVYAFVQAAVKHALAQFSIAPSLDFTLNADIQSLDAISKPFTHQNQEAATGSNLYKTFTNKHQAHIIEPNENSELRHWRDFFVKKETDVSYEQQPLNSDSGAQKKPIPVYDFQHQTYIQLHNTYILSASNNGFILVHQQHAHERILYEKYNLAFHSQIHTTQKSLFPITLELAVPDAILLEDLLPEIIALGYAIEPFGTNTFVIQGTPADVAPGNEKHSIELLLEQFKHFSSDIKFGKREKLVRCISRQHAIKAGQALQQKEMQTLLEQLFACTTPNTTPSGNPTFLEFKEDYLDKMFGK